MMQFKSVELSDKKEIDTCLAHTTFRTCDYCFTNMYAWKARFKSSFAVVQQTLFLRYADPVSTYCYGMPIGKMPLDKALKLIIDDAKENGNRLVIKGVAPEMWNAIEKAMPDIFVWEHDRDNDEYIYSSEKLIRLKGKKLQNKRNHINRFKADNPNWYYFPLSTREELDGCVDLLDEWENLNVEKAEKSLRYDYVATRKMLDNFHTLELKGGAICVNGRMIAFTLGEKLTDDTFVVHVEKAFSDINGAYAIINQQFAEHEAQDYTYINREEDMGLENLRKAKLSYQPEILLQEKTLWLKSEK
ncbi:MAG: phosphatidylglycerol lysyltransferase domain-containing protein [Prevotellaceae bacterium]|jgi:hypothetical protein|nr:phosphatidylglycerol lysyltransferase domain-containing protein [Prevotellaceae bacterium]